VLLQARKFGVRSAMPGFIARKLCPQVRHTCLVPSPTAQVLLYDACTQQAQRSCCQLLRLGLQTQAAVTVCSIPCTL
jgi:hypothetical protein